MKRVVLSQEATEEYRAGCAEYERQRAGRAQRFRAAIVDQLRLIRRNPKIGVPGLLEYRKRVVPGWPYVIFYLDRPDIIWIAAIYHGSREPNAWLSRIQQAEEPS